MPRISPEVHVIDGGYRKIYLGHYITYLYMNVMDDGLLIPIAPDVKIKEILILDTVSIESRVRDRVASITIDIDLCH